MSMPNIPDIKPDIDICRNDVINLLLASIALEEIGLAHIINAEGEKIQCITEECDKDNDDKGSHKCTKLEDLLEINKSVQITLRDVIKKEMLLEFKFENILDLMCKDKECKDKDK